MASGAFAKDIATLWTIGEKDGRSSEFALAPEGYKDFIEHDFGYEDKYFIAGWSETDKDFPYVLPGPVDTWGGTWRTSGWRTHEVNILFSLAEEPGKNEEFRLDLDLADFAKTFLPLVKITVTGEIVQKTQLEAEGFDVRKQRHPNRNEKIKDESSLKSDSENATPAEISLPL